MTNHPPSNDPAANDPTTNDSSAVSNDELLALEQAGDALALESAAPEPAALEAAFEPLALEAAAVEPLEAPSDVVDEQLVTDPIPTVVAAAAAMSDDELVAAANASLHDEGHMANSAPDSAGSNPASEPGVPNPGTGAPNPGAGAYNSGGQLPPTPPNPPGYGSAPPVRRVYRSRQDRKLGGVSAGIAEFFRIDPTVVRLATLVSAFTGIGILVYIAAWFIIPLRPDGYIEAPRSTPVADERTMTLAFGIAALALAFGIVTGSWAVLAIALIGGGVWLLSEHTAMAPGFAGAAPVSGTSNYQAPGAYEPGYAPAAPSMGGGYMAPPAPAGFVPPVPPPQFADAAPRERKPQHITWTVLSLLALLTAVGIAASTGNWWDVSMTRLMGAGVVIIGVGIVAGQIRRGGARGLIPLGILTAIALFPVSAVDGLIDDGIGEANYRPTTIAELQTSYELGIGELIVDLSDLDFSGRTESIDIDLGIGELIVIVSEDTGGQAMLQATAGEVSHFVSGTSGARYREGVNVESNTVLLEGENGTLELSINVGLGTAELRSEGN